MTLLHAGLAAAGLACVAIPIIIHLLMRRRRRPVMWGAMRFLREAYRRQRRRLLIEKWLLLAARMLLVALVALALGRPLIGSMSGTAGAGRTVYILLDNGIASAMTDAEGERALERHKRAALDLIEQLGSQGAEADRVALITLGSPASGVVLPPSTDLGAVAQLVEGVRPTDARTDVPGALRMVAGAVQASQEGQDREAGRPFVAVFSDFVSGSADAGERLAELPEGVRLLASAPLASVDSPAPSNIGISSVEPLRSLFVTQDAGPGDGGADRRDRIGEQIAVTLRRSGPAVSRGAEAQVTVRVGAPGEPGQPVTGRVLFEPGEGEATTTVQASGRLGARDGVGVIEALLSAPAEVDAIASDNIWRRPVEVRTALRVGVVAPRRFGADRPIDTLDPGEWVRLALRPGDGSGVDVGEIDPASLAEARLNEMDALVLPRPDLLKDEAWQRVRVFADSGGLVILMPPPGVTVHVWADAMADALQPGWRLPREAAEPSAGVKLAAPAPSDDGASFDLLALLRGEELAALAAPVEITRALPLLEAPAGGRTLLTLGEGGPVILWAGRPGAEESASGTPPRGAQGLVVYFGLALDWDWTNLPAKPLIVPLMQELVRQGVGRAQGSWWSLAGQPLSPPEGAVELRRMQMGDEEPAGAESVFEVTENGALSATPRHAGLLSAIDERGGTRGVVAVNPDVRGADVELQSREEIGAWLGAALADTDASVTWIEPAASAPDGQASPAGDLLAPTDDGTPISFALLIAAAVIALAELFIARFASHAQVPGAGTGPVGGGA